MKEKNPQSTQKKIESNYTVVLNILGVEKKHSGKTIEEALNKFNLGMAEIKGRGTVEVTQGDKKYTRFATRPQLIHIFRNPNVWAKNLSFLTDNNSLSNL